MSETLQLYREFLDRSPARFPEIKSINYAGEVRLRLGKRLYSLPLTQFQCEKNLVTYMLIDEKQATKERWCDSLSDLLQSYKCFCGLENVFKHEKRLFSKK